MKTLEFSYSEPQSELNSDDLLVKSTVPESCSGNRVQNCNLNRNWNWRGVPSPIGVVFKGK
jgi:hypothetical protein